MFWNYGSDEALLQAQIPDLERKLKSLERRVGVPPLALGAIARGS